MKHTNYILKLVTAALLAAIIFTVTRVLLIPVPGNGYIHPGDAFVLLSGIILGPIFGGLAAGIGSSMSDIFSPYIIYAPATFIIKMSAAALAYYSYKKIRKNSVILAGLLSSVVITLGYFLYDNIIYNLSMAIFNFPFNILQNIMGIVIVLILLPLLKNVPQVKSWLNQNNIL